MRGPTLVPISVVIGLACAVVSGRVQATMLLDHGPPTSMTAFLVVSDMANDGSSGFTLFQPFTVTDPVWEIDTINIFGKKHSLSDGSGVTATLVPDLWGWPQENNPIESALYPIQLSDPDWMTMPFDVTLTSGRYWIIFSPATPMAFSLLGKAAIGEDSFSRRQTDGQEFRHHVSTTLRIMGGAIPEPSTLLLLGLGAVMLRRKR